MKTPWTADEVARLNAMQKNRNYHPYTCPGGGNGSCRKAETGGVLVATENGWICETCDYRQDWAHDCGPKP